MKYYEIEVITGDSTNPSVGILTLPEGSFILLHEGGNDWSNPKYTLQIIGTNMIYQMEVDKFNLLNDELLNRLSA